MNRFKLARIGKGLTMTQLANMTGVSLSYIHHIENGKREPTKEYLDIVDPSFDSQWYDEIMSAVKDKFFEDKSEKILTSLDNALKFAKSRSNHEC